MHISASHIDSRILEASEVICSLDSDDTSILDAEV